MPILSLVGSEWRITDSCPPAPPPAGASWVVKNTIDLTGLDPVNIPVSAVPGSTVLNKGGSPFIELFHDYSGAGLVYDVNAGASGIRGDWVSGTTNYLTLAFAITDLLGANPVPDTTWRGIYSIQLLVDNITYVNVSGERFSFVIAAGYNNMLGDLTVQGGTIKDDGASGTSIEYISGTDVNAYSTLSATTSACFNIVLWNGVMTDILIDYGSSYTTPYAEAYGPMLNYRSPSKGVPYANPYGTGYVAAVSRRRTNGTLKGIRVLKYE